jgi:hypothetical protein
MGVEPVTATEIRRDAEADLGGCCESLTMAVKDEVPLLVGVPEIEPDEEFKVTPAGKEPLEIDHV